MSAIILVLSQEDFDNWFNSIGDEDKKLLEELTKDDDEENVIGN